MLPSTVRRFAGLLLLSLAITACNDSAPVVIAPTPVTPAPVPENPVVQDQGKALSSYLHDLSVADPSVTYENARLEQYRIPTSSGAVLDGWIRRPPGDKDQPLVIIFTPYYGGGDPTSPANLLGETGSSFAKFLLPFGYAIGHISVAGTGNSSDCFRDGGAIERKQLYEAVEYMAAQPWSNGKVAAIGVSYDGTTANELFVDPPPSLKTVVPMEAITDYYRYSFNNGMRRGSNSAFTAYYYAIVGAGPVGLNGGVGPTDPVNFVEQLAGEACTEQVTIQAQGAYSTATGDKQPAYWDDRDAIKLIKASLDKPRPSMFYIQGYQDANVDPQMTQGFLDVVKETGVPLHIWYGQWVHNYPEPTTVETPCKVGEPCRKDFFQQTLIAWFDQWLKGKDTGILDAPMMQTQGDDAVWRHESSWPPSEVSTLALHPTADGALGAAAGSGEVSYTDDLATVQPGDSVAFVSEPLDKPLRLTGLPRLETVATADRPKAGLVATLLEQFPDGTRRYVNFAAQSLNHVADPAAGALDITDKAIPVNVELFMQDNVLKAGSRLVLVLGSQVAAAGVPVGVDSSNFLTGGPNLMPVGVGATVQLALDKTTLYLPVNAGDRVETLPWIEAAAAE